MYCVECKYPLTRIDARRCPECGTGFDQDDPLTYLVSPRLLKPKTARAVTVYLGIPLAFGCVLLSLACGVIAAFLLLRAL